MADIKDWSNTAAGNNIGAPPDYPVEGMPASAVNDTMRENMSAVRRQWEQHSFFDWGDTITYVSDTSFDASGDGVVADRYQVGRRVLVTGTTTGTIVGTITGTAGDFVVTVTWDSGTLAADVDLAAALGLDADRPAVGLAGVAGLSDLALVPTGVVMPYAAAAAPADYLLCDGTTYNIATYPALGALLGDTFGGDGVATFAVPNMGGRAPVGIGTADSIAWALGDTAGADTHTLTEAEMPQHQHAQQANTRLAASAGFTLNPGATDGALGGLTGFAGNDQPHNNVQPSIGLNYIIKT